jgi:hypothetical protein
MQQKALLAKYRYPRREVWSGSPGGPLNFIPENNDVKPGQNIMVPDEPVDNSKQAHTPFLRRQLLSPRFRSSDIGGSPKGEQPVDAGIS